jgi:hypothetical protein
MASTPTRFPQNSAIVAVESAAKEASANGAFALDAILFGKWRDCSETGGVILLLGCQGQQSSAASLAVVAAV